MFDFKGEEIRISNPFYSKVGNPSMIMKDGVFTSAFMDVVQNLGRK